MTIRLALTSCALTLAVALPAALRAEPPLPAPIVKRIEEATQDCKAFEDGTLTVNEGAVTQIDLNGDGTPDWVLDESGFTCSTAASYFCGSGGCSSLVVVGDSVTELFGYGWQLVETKGGPVLLSFVGGTDCGEVNAAACVRAYVWDEGKFNTVSAPTP